METDVKYLRLEALAVAALARQDEVGHELHLDGDGAFTLALLAAPAIGIEAEVSGRESHLLSKRHGRIEFPYLVPRLDVRDGIGACALAYGVLVDELDGMDHLHVAFETDELARSVGNLIQLALHGIIEDIAHEAALATAAYSGDTRHHAQRETHVDAFQVVGTGSFHLDVAVRLATAGGKWNYFLTCEEAKRVRGVASTHDAFRRTIVYDLTSQTSCFGTDVDEPVGSTDDFLVMLYDNDRVAEVAKLLQHLDEPFCVAAVEADTRFVQNIETPHQAASQRCGEVDALAFTSRKAVRRAIQRQVTKADVH